MTQVTLGMAYMQIGDLACGCDGYPLLLWGL